MTITRLVRIAGFATAFFAAFSASQSMTVARNAGETVPGIHFSIAALAFFFLLGAVVTERTQGPEFNLRKDMLWGLGTGGLAIVAARLLS